MSSLYAELFWVHKRTVVYLRVRIVFYINNEMWLNESIHLLEFWNDIDIFVEIMVNVK